MAAPIGTVEPFNRDTDNWTYYCERLAQFFVANGISDPAKQRAVLLSACGGGTYQLIRSLVFPAKPTERSFSEIVKLVHDHLLPAPSSIVQRFKFFCRSQQDSESVSQFVAELRKLSELCEFGDTLDVMLRDRLVCGLRNQKLQQRLLAESNLTFAKAFEIAQTAELSEQNAKDLQRPETMEVHVMNKKGQERTMATSNCFRCHGNHLASECRFKSVDCNNCGKRGHIARACRQIREDRYPASAASSTRRVPRSRERKQDSPELLQTDTLYTFRSPDPLRAPVKINNVTIEMEIDTGAAACSFGY